MGIDQAGHDQPTGGIDHFMLAVGREMGADRGDAAVCNEDIGDRRMMDIAVMVVDLPASNQQLFCACHDGQPFLLIAPARPHKGCTAPWTSYTESSPTEISLQYDWRDEHAVDRVRSEVGRCWIAAAAYTQVVESVIAMCACLGVAPVEVGPIKDLQLSLKRAFLSRGLLLLQPACCGLLP
jgi:hypothetical protein